MKSFLNTLLLVVGLAVLPVMHAFAAPLSQFKPQSNTTIRDALVALTDERVALSLDSGNEIEGKVILVGDSIVYLQLAGKFFHRAVVKLEDISAITLKRDY